MVSHRGKRLGLINRSIEQFMEIDDLNINQSIDTIEKLLTE